MPTEERILALHEQSLTLVEKIKAAKQQQCKTIQQLADETGIPRTTLNRFFAGTLMNPGFMDVCALCASLELSADELIGLSPQKSDDSVTVDFLQLEIEHKDEMLQEKDNAISRLLDRSRKSGSQKLSSSPPGRGERAFTSTAARYPLRSPRTTNARRNTSP